MAELFFGPTMDKIINTCFEYLQDHLTWQTCMKKELERLRENHPKIQAVVSATSQAHIIDQDTSLNKWIWQLRDAIDEADDLLDEFAYKQHKEDLAKNKEKEEVASPFKILKESLSKIRKVGKGFFKTGLKIDSDLTRLEEVVQKLDKISAEVSTFLHLLEHTKQVEQEQHLELLKAREEGCLPSSNLIGRGQEKEYIIQWLGKPSTSNEEEQQSHITTTNIYSNISLLAIVGHGGMGKTSLLQHIYEDEVTKEFDLKMWVCVSNKFEVQQVIADMLESAKMNRPSLKKIDALQHSLKLEVMSNKFLLVLDDIWEEDEERDKNKWKKVIAPLAYGSLGSKILITTRMDSVASMISKVIEKNMEKLTLKGLKEDECLLLLNTHAFANVKNQDDHKKLKFIAVELVKKLSGSPLAAKVMGGVLNSNLDESIFVQDHNFDKDDLVRMWIAVGFIQPSDIQGEALEDVGGRYFDLLVNKSFFDKFDSKYYKYYKMHDLLHDMARSISAQESFRFVGDDQKLFTGVRETIRHLSIKTSNIEVLRNLGKFKNLRTLWITCDGNNQDFDDVLAKIFKETRSIRLLYINNYRPKLIPETIGYLIHLRYLSLDFSALTPFPTPLCNLYHLQFIISNNHFLPHLHDDFFPRDTRNLSNLHYTSFSSLNFPGIGKLKFLQELTEFCVKNEKGYRIGELEHMNDLRILTIKVLENVRDAEEACNAKLCDKRNLANLSLNWGEEYEREMRINIADPNLDERVLANLQPHHNLKVLEISDYMGVRSARWMKKADLIYNLEHIELHACLEWQNLPPFGQLPFLKFLRLHNMPKAKRFDNKYNGGNDECCVFQSLKLLNIDRLEAFEDWFDGGVKDENGCLFPCLTKLILKDCPNLQELPYLPTKLKSMEITNIGWKTLKFCSISKSVPLETLVVRHCPNITYIFPVGEINKLAALETVEFEDCPKLIYFGGDQEVETIENIPTSVESSQCLLSSLSAISSLKKLSLKSIPLLKSLKALPPSLHSLYLKNIGNLDCLPSCLPTLSSLTHLYIIEVPKLRELTDLPPSLCKLQLRKLDNLDCLPSCLPTLPSLIRLSITKAPKLRELPDLPPSLISLCLNNLDSLDCLPSCFPTLSSLTRLYITKVPKLRELPNLPPSLKIEDPSFFKNRRCHLEFMERLKNFNFRHN